MVASITKRVFLEAALRRWTQQPASERDQLMLRGSFLTAQWVGPHRRWADDLDFVGRYTFDQQRLVGDWQRVLTSDARDGVRFDTESLQAEIIFAETDFPGVRIQVAAYCEGESELLQIDVGFGDPIPLGPVLIRIPTPLGTLEVLTPRPELGFGWKLHGLVEKDGFTWRPKDVADLWLMLQHVCMDDDAVSKAIGVAFESRDCPLWRLDRLANGQMGHSSPSRRRWRKWIEANPHSELPEDLQTVLMLIADRVRQFWRTLRTEPDLYAITPRLDETQQAIAKDKDFAEFPWQDGGKTFVYERISKTTFPDPLAAATAKEARRRLLRQEARGITFDRDGTVLARPYPRFDRFHESMIDALQDAEAYEKLDGSLVFPTLDSSSATSYKWRTRRGCSEIADQASRCAARANADYDGLVQSCITARKTPMFEWCSRQRPIVFDHPQDRLVLTGVRENDSGRLMGYAQLRALASEFGVELAAYLGKVEDPQEFLAQVHGWQDREGAVVHCSNGRLYKFKSDRYFWLHRAVEGPHQDRARWRLILENASDQLCTSSRLRGWNLEQYVADVESAVARTAVRIENSLAEFSGETAEQRANLATHLKNTPNWQARLYFNAFESTDIVGIVRQFAIDSCEQNALFLKAAKFMNGPLHEDSIE